MWCVCYVCRKFYHCIIMDLESVNKQLYYIMLYYNNVKILRI